MTGTEEMKSKEQQTPTSKRLNPHLTGSAGIEKKRGRRKESALFRPTHPGIGEDWKKRGTVPRSKPIHSAP
jgi:hypothetical protein